MEFLAGTATEKKDMFTIPYVYDRCKKKHPGLEKPKSHAMEKSNTAWLYKFDFTPQGLHNLPASFLFVKIIDRHSCFLCTCFHGDDPILHQGCICTESVLRAGLQFCPLAALPIRSSFNSSAIKTRNASHNPFTSFPFPYFLHVTVYNNLQHNIRKDPFSLSANAPTSNKYCLIRKTVQSK